MLQSFVAVCIDILPMPGGVGVNEGFFVTLFKQIMSRSTAVSAMLLSRGVNFYILMIIGAVVAVYTSARKVTESFQSMVSGRSAEEQGRTALTGIAQKWGVL